jgi:hypothetical protein
MKVSLRFDVFKRDGFTCQYCGRNPPAVVLEVDHVHPKAKGGRDQIDNLLTACFDCNRGKRDGLLHAAPASIEEKAAALKEKRKQLRAFNKLLEDQAADLDRGVDRVDAVLQQFHPQAYFSAESRASIKQFLQKLPEQEVVDAMERALNRVEDPRRAFKYFCGTCWRKIKA